MLKYTIFILLCLSLFSCKKEMDFADKNKNQPYYPDLRLKEVFRMNDTDIEGETDPYFNRTFSVDTFLIIRTSRSIQVRSIRTMELLWTIPHTGGAFFYGFEDVSLIDGKLVFSSDSFYLFYDPISGQLLQSIFKLDYLPPSTRSRYLSNSVRNGTDTYFAFVTDISLYHYDWSLYHHDLSTNTFTELYKFENVRLGNASFGGIYRPISITEDGKQILISLNISINDEDSTGIYSFNTENKTMKRIYDEPRVDHILHNRTKGLINGNHYYFLDVKGNTSGIRFDENAAERLFGVIPQVSAGYDAFSRIEMHNGKFYGIHSSSISSFDPVSGKILWSTGQVYFPVQSAYIDNRNLTFTASYKNVGNKRQYSVQIMDLNDGQILVEEFPPMEDKKETNFTSIIYSPVDQTIIVQNLFTVIKYELPELFK